VIKQLENPGKYQSAARLRGITPEIEGRVLKSKVVTKVSGWRSFYSED